MANLGSGLAGLLEGFSNTFGRQFMQRQAQDAQTKAALQVANFKAAQKHFMDLPDDQKLKVAMDPDFQKGFIQPMMKGDIPKADVLVNIMSIPNRIQAAGTKMVDARMAQMGGGDGSAPAPSAPPSGAQLLEGGPIPTAPAAPTAATDIPPPTGAPGQYAPTGPGDNGAGQPATTPAYIPAGYPGAGPAPVAPSAPAPAVAAPAVVPSLAPAVDEPRTDINIKLPGGISMTMKDLSVADKEKNATKRAFVAFERGIPEAEATKDLSPTSLKGFYQGVQQLAGRQIQELQSHGLSTDAAIAATAGKYGVHNLPEIYQKLVVAEPVAAAGARGRFPYQEELQNNASRLRISEAGPISEARVPAAKELQQNASDLRVNNAEEEAGNRARGSITVKAQLDPNERQQLGTALQFDMTEPLSPEQENQLIGAKRLKDSMDAAAKTTATVGAEEAQRPSAANVNARAAGVPVGPLTTEGAQAIQEREHDQKAQLIVDEAKAKVKAGMATPIAVKDRPLLIDPNTEQQLPAGATYRDANKVGAVALRPNDVATFRQLKGVEKFLDVYQSLANDVFTSENPIANAANYRRLQLSADPRITELRALAPEFTGYIRLKGERGQSTEGDIDRGYRGLAYGEGIGAGFVRKAGVAGAIKNARTFTDETRKGLGFKSKLGGNTSMDVGAKIDLGGITVERTK